MEKFGTPFTLRSPEGGRNSEEIPGPEPVNIDKILGDATVLFVSDDHTSLRNKDAFKDLLPALKERGVTELFLEMLPKGFDTENDTEIKKYWGKRLTPPVSKYKDFTPYFRINYQHKWAFRGVKRLPQYVIC